MASGIKKCVAIKNALLSSIHEEDDPNWWFKIKNTDTSTIYPSINGTIDQSVRLQYSYDGENWTDFVIEGSVFSYPSIDKGKSIYIVAGETGNTRLTAEGSELDNPFSFSFVGNVSISGNIMSLLNRNEELDVIPSDYCFCGLFKDNWGKIDISKLVLGAKTLSKNCYREMFNNSQLSGKGITVKAETLEEDCFNSMFQDSTGNFEPFELNITELKNRCYCSMFDGSSLKKAPSLPATVLGENCYEFMFRGCQITSAPELPAEIMKACCYRGMFSRTYITEVPTISATTLDYACFQKMFEETPISTAPELPFTNLEIRCYNEMFSGCSSLTAAPELPATELKHGCYEDMFHGCSSLSSAPELNSTNLVSRCYSGMFDGCTSLSSAPELNSTNLAEYCYSKMFADCASLSSAPTLPGTILDKSCYYAMFAGCTSLSSAPILNSTNLAESCYSNMFAGCTSLSSAPELPATELQPSCYESMFISSAITACPELNAQIMKKDCYNQMFMYCSNITEPRITLPSMSLAEECYKMMFAECDSLIVTPALPATSLAQACYTNMFSGCKSLTRAPALPSTTLATECYNSMFSACTSLTETPELNATSLPVYCYYNMFSGCTSLTSSPFLPAQTANVYSYNRMFYNCSNLKEVSTNLTNFENGTTDWLYGVSEYGNFRGDPSLEALINTPGYNKNPSTIPEKWVAGESVKVTLNYYNNKEHVVETQYVTIGGNVSITKNYQRTGYEFLHWDKPLTNITEDCTITAMYSYNGLCFWTENDSYISLTTDSELERDPNIYYSTDCNNWTKIITHTPFLLKGGERTYIKTKGSSNTFSTSECAFSFIADETNTISAEGNIMSLLDEYLELDTVKEYSFKNLFYGFPCLTQAPSLPAKYVKAHGYEGMFIGCSRMSWSPELPSEQPEEYAYHEMFKGCSNLMLLPLPADWMISDTERKISSNWMEGVTTTAGTVNCTGNLRNALNNHIVPYGSSTIPSGWSTYVEEFAITLKYYQGDVEKTETQTVAMGCDVVLPEDYEKTDCEFIGWDKPVTKIKSSETITAQYEFYAVSFTIRNKPEGINPYVTLSWWGNWDESALIPVMLEYSYDKINWIPFTTSLYGSTYIYLDTEDTVYLRASSDNAKICDNDNGWNFQFGGIDRWSHPDSYFDCGGNIMSLLSTDKTLKTLNSDYIFKRLFQNAETIKTTPRLPATTLSEGCYYEMFAWCYKLEKAPDLPAEILKKNCYEEMFVFCYALKTFPAFNCTTADEYSCYNMFNGVNNVDLNLTLTASTVSNYSYYEMFCNCSEIGGKVVIKANKLKQCCCDGMFSGYNYGSTVTRELDVEIDADNFDGRTQFCSYMFGPQINLKHIRLPNVTSWEHFVTYNWISPTDTTSQNGVLHCNQTLKDKFDSGEIERGNNTIPESWTISVDY